MATMASIDHHQWGHFIPTRLPRQRGRSTLLLQPDEGKGAASEGRKSDQRLQALGDEWVEFQKIYSEL